MGAQTFVVALAFPILILNSFGGIIAGVWLAILGRWWAIGWGFASVFAPTVLGLAMMPGVAFGAPAALLAEKGRTVLAFPLVLLSLIYTAAVITVWCLFVLFFFMSRSSGGDFWPLQIWSYVVAITPLAYMTQSEEQRGTGDAASMTTFFAGLAYLLMVLAGILHIGSNLTGLATAFGAVMLVGVFLQTYAIYSSIR